MTHISLQFARRRVPLLPSPAGAGLRLTLFLASLALGAPAPAAQPIAVLYGPPSQTATLGSTVVDWSSLVPRATPVGQMRSVFDNPTATLEKLEVHVTTLRPGMASHPPHQHPWEELLLIKEGSVVASINGQDHPAGPGSLIFYASHDAHNVRNESDAPATYYVINFVTDRVHSVPDIPASVQAVPGRLPSSVIDCDGLKSTPTKIGAHTDVVDSPTLTFLRLESHITTLDTGQGTKPDNVDPGDELFILKAGTLEARINGVASRIGAGSLFYCAPNAKRTFTAAGGTPATYQVIKVVSDKSPGQPGA
jgi:quercetin dioxygenase-like cupin family protein